MGLIRVRVDDAEVASVALFAPLPVLQRLDVLPFIILYITAVYLYLTRPENDVVAALLTAFTAFANALTFLLGEWSVDMSAWLGYTPLRQLQANSSTSLASPVYVKVVPAHTMLPRQLCRCVAVGARPTNAEEKSEDVPLLWFSYQNLTFCLYDDLKAVHAGLASFRRLDFPTQHPLSFYSSARGFVKPQDVERAQLKWGKNDFDIPVPQFAALLQEQLVAPFFVFQFFCMLLWCLDEYVYYSLMTLAMLVVFECTVVLQRQRNMQMLNGMRRAPQPLFVYRANKWTELWSDQLVPGDICSIGQKLSGVGTRRDEDKVTSVPCDMLLLRGDCVVNESMLTGESVPLRKEALARGDDDDNTVLAINDGSSQLHKKHVLYGGTKLLQHSLPENNATAIKISNAPDRGCLVFVLRTGFGTTQGSLMRTILHSSQRVTSNTAEAFWFILLLLGFAVVSAGFVLHQGLNDPTRNRSKLFLHTVMIITSVVPPELPMELSLAVTNSLIALTKLNIFCTEPFRIPFAGRVDVCCFDKTGTLTSDELKMRGITGLDTGGAQGHASELDLIAPEHLPLDTELVLAGCQSLVFLNGQVMGDPLEMTALQKIKWTLSFGYHRSSSAVEPSVFSNTRGVVDTVNILHRYSFSSDLKRMTTIASVVKSDNDEQDELRVLTKGAPEVLEPLFALKPAHYSRVYRHFAAKGCRVLALGYRRLGPSASISVSELVRHQTRSDIERDLIFAGFLVLDCPLKEDTKRTIRDLVASQHKAIVITGDNALTACDAAQQIGVNDKKSKEPLILRVKEASAGQLEWRGVDDGSKKEADILKLPFSPATAQALSLQHDLCVTGEALAALLASEEQQRGSDTSSAFEAYQKSLTALCPFVNVFARSSPQQKEHILMALNRAGKITAMCGDGTNDVGALKRAHVGVSIVNNPDAENSQRSLAADFATTKNGALQDRLRAIQEEEEMGGSVRLGDASIASPFTSKSSSIRVVKQLIRQGRCTLVTTIQMYKILGVNCLITAYYLSSLYIHGIKNGDQQLTIVGLSIAMFFLFLSRAKPAKRLSPQRPPSSVFCKPVLVSIIGQSFVHLGFLVYALHIAQPFVDYADPAMHPDGKFSPNVVNSIMFLMSAVMQLNTFVANYKGKPFMESFWSNALLSRSALVSYVVLTLAVLEALSPLNAALELVPFPNAEVQMVVLGLMVGDTVAVLVLEWVIDRLAVGSIANRK